MMGWVGDFFRFWWSLFYWNMRKTVFRWRGGRCPCQNPSDSGRALETACDACTSWHRPARFRRVCPLLVATPVGLRCSADTKDVQPFWGRALGFCGGAGAAVYLAAVLGAFAVLRGIGYPVNFVAVAWPPAWREIRVARAEYFYEAAGAALAKNRVNEALLALSYAYNLNPRNCQAGLLLAKLWQMNQPVLSDRLYARLLQDNPGQAAAIAEEWYRALLARGDFPKIAQLAPTFLADDPAHAPVWLYAVFFATRRLGDPEPLRRLLEKKPPLSPGLHRLAEIEWWIQTGRSSDAHAALLSLAPDTAYGFYYQISELTALGFSDDALLALDRAGAALPQRERIALRMDAFAANGWQSLVHNEVELVLTAAPTAPAVELLCAQFIRHPDAASLADLFEKIEQHPLPPSSDAYQAALALFCAAGVNADWSDLRTARSMIRQMSGAHFATLDVAEAYFRGQSAERRLGSVLPMLQPLELDVTYALFEHYGGNRASARAP
ncbi:MAG TPA: hypothetical protein VMI53_07735 [Opitutaceae bacterium]|nr:hypothetical protein [Opitutaceae bacterium]